MIVKKHVEHLITVVKLDVKLTWLLNQIKHNKLLSILKTHCVATELSDNNNEMKNITDFLNIQQLIDSMSSFFWNLILISSQNVEVFLYSS
jgi:hypothetical protein